MDGERFEQDAHRALRPTEGHRAVTACGTGCWGHQLTCRLVRMKSQHLSDTSLQKTLFRGDCGPRPARRAFLQEVLSPWTSPSPEKVERTVYPRLACVLPGSTWRRAALSHSRRKHRWVHPGADAPATLSLFLLSQGCPIGSGWALKSRLCLGKPHHWDPCRDPGRTHSPIFCPFLL